MRCETFLQTVVICSEKDSSSSISRPSSLTFITLVNKLPLQVISGLLVSNLRVIRNALKADEKADVPADLAVLPRKLSYRVSRNYVSLFLFACRSRGCYFLLLLLEKLCICVVFEARTSTNNKCTFSVLMTSLFLILFTGERKHIYLNNFILSTAS